MQPNITYKKECEVCKNSYEARHNKSKYCSNLCKARAFRSATRNGSSVSGEVSIVERIGTIERGLLAFSNKLTVMAKHVSELSEYLEVVTQSEQNTRRTDKYLEQKKVEALAPASPLTKSQKDWILSYEKAKIEGGVYDNESGWIPIEDLDRPEWYRQFLSGK